MRIPEIKIENFPDGETVVKPEFGLYSVRDYMGRELTMPCISLVLQTEPDGEDYAVLTKSFGEFIGIKNATYIDTNNCPCAEKFLILGLARDTGFTKSSGFCEYPLWQFDEQFLREIGGDEYEEYASAFERYMNPHTEEDVEKNTEECYFEQTM